MQLRGDMPQQDIQTSTPGILPGKFLKYDDFTVHCIVAKLQ